MAIDDHELWHRLGHSVERIRGGAPIQSVLETLKDLGGSENGVSSLAARVIATLPVKKKAGLKALVAAAVAGAGAAALVEACSRLLRSETFSDLDRDATLTLLLAGAGRGLTFGGAVEPRVPGPAYVAGFLYGTVEYLTSRWGGLSALLDTRSPHSAMPFLARAVDERGKESVEWVEHVAFGLALALLYDSFRRNSGIEDDE